MTGIIGSVCVTSSYRLVSVLACHICRKFAFSQLRIRRRTIIIKLLNDNVCNHRITEVNIINLINFNHPS